METSADCQQTTQHYMPEDKRSRQPECENLTTITDMFPGTWAPNTLTEM
jgi:hypothetical protein